MNKDNKNYFINIDKSNNNEYSDKKEIDVFESSKPTQKVEKEFSIEPSFAHKKEKIKSKSTKTPIDEQTKSKSSTDNIQYKYSAKKYAKRKLKRIIKQPKSDKKTFLLVLMVYGAVAFVVGSILITRYSNICIKDRELDQLEDEIAEISLNIDEKILDLSMIDYINKIEFRAKKDFGMHYPNNSQIRYIDLEEYE